ncbi:hypothetical protein GCM10009552_21050 [Rothia nasimurium]
MQVVSRRIDVKPTDQSIVSFQKKKVGPGEMRDVVLVLKTKLVVKETAANVLRPGYTGKFGRTCMLVELTKEGQIFITGVPQANARRRHHEDG